MEGEVRGITAHASEARALSSFRTKTARREGRLASAGLILAFTLLGLVLRVFRLGFQPLWWDEGYSAWFATHRLGQMVRLTAEDIHPPLYYALLHGWTLLAGRDPVSLRLVSVVAGVAAVPLMYVAASQILGSRRAGLLAAFLLAINPLHVYYSQEVRMYGLVALLSLGVTWTSWALLSASESRKREAALLSIAYVILTTLALYTQYYAVFLPIAATFFAASYWRREPKRLLRWLALQAPVVLLYLPWVIYAGPRLTLYVSQKVLQDADKPLGLLAYLGRHLSAFAAGHLEGGLGAWWPLALLLLLPTVAGLIVRGLGRGRVQIQKNETRERRETLNGESRADRHAVAVGFLATMLLVALVLGWLIGLRYPFFPDRGERLLLLALPAFIMLAAAGIDALIWGRQSGEISRTSRLAGYAGLALFVVASALSLAGFYTVPRYKGDDYRPLIARIVEQGLPGDTVFSVYPWQVGYWRSYAGSTDGPEAVLSPAGEWGPKVQSALDEALERGRVWFPAHLALGAILETQTERYLASRAIPFANTWYGPGTRLSAWTASAQTEIPEPSTAGAEPLVAYDLPGGGELDLVGARAPGEPVPAANGIAPVALSWQASAAPPELAVSVRMVDDLGQIWAQNDYAPVGAMAGSPDNTTEDRAWRAVDRFGLLVPAGTPPGRYKVELVVLPKDSERPLAGRVPGADPTRSARLFEVEVTPPDRPLTPDRLAITQKQPVDLQDGLRFLGYTVDRTPLAPGELRRISLFWQATGQPSSDYTAFVQMIGKNGAPIAAWYAAPGAAHPTSKWTPGTLMRTQASLRPGAEIPDGRYPLIAGMYRPADGARLLTAAGKDALALGSLDIKGRRHEMEEPKIVPRSAKAVEATFGGLARLIAYDGPSSAAGTSGAADVTLYWQALDAMPAPQTAFVHLVDERTNAVIGYGDSEPGNGAYPTAGWLKGEYLADSHTIIFPAASAQGQPVRIEVGLYDPATGKRLTLADGSDSFVVWRGRLDG